ncbi:E3 ubiquitin-protein ligase TRIM33-like [Frankliniella occidentalis]|uniref:E3 ubiquitin-protein ligase TRIM33-like n=1 Tax=Frankliniella occidentalis TaxID=133901 RepID=A0A9C6WV82_FRAOC|nr:E3 ubiquitin-protein ligase TRIM33-like [Frankliniella occidentalis]
MNFLVPRDQIQLLTVHASLSPALPQKGPEITGLERPEYQMGDTLSVNCTSDRSYPAAKLRWYINDRPVDPSHEAQLSAHGLVRSQARLVVRVGPQHFKDGSMALRCVATIRPPNQQQLQQQQHQHDQHEQHEHQREQQQQRQPLSAATGSHSQQRAEHAPLSSKHGHHQPLPRIAMEIDNREAKLFDQEIQQNFKRNSSKFTLVAPSRKTAAPEQDTHFVMK